jgi:hypothetical protein
MSDENYSLVLLQIICLLMFSCGVVALTQHPEWFGAPNKTATSQNYSPESATPASHSQALSASVLSFIPSSFVRTLSHAGRLEVLLPRQTRSAESGISS